MKLRKAVGIIILNTRNKIIAFQRVDLKENWQCPEGGVENNETYEEAMFRELYEEVGLKSSDFDVIAKSEKSFDYLYPKSSIKYKEFDGQAKYFFVVKLKNDNYNFDFNKFEVEFINYKVLENNKDIIDLVPSFKKEIYKDIIKYFNL